jgi:hypothetical protein
MATQTKTILDVPRKAGHAYLDTTEWAAERVADLQRRAGDATSIEWVADIAGAQADVTRDVAAAYVSAGRKLVG